MRTAYHRIKRKIFPDTILIHVGKSGGSSLGKAMHDAQIWHKTIHIQSIPRIRKRVKYYLLLRNPISRAISAFNWRYRLVVTEGTQHGRFPGEHEALVHYGSLNGLAEALFVNGEENKAAVADFQKIHHLRESISFYFSKVPVRHIAPHITGVLFQESLSSDYHRLFGKEFPQYREKKNAKPGDNQLSPLARQNLTRMLAEDFEVIETLFELGLIDEPTVQRARQEQEPT